MGWHWYLPMELTVSLKCGDENIAIDFAGLESDVKRGSGQVVPQAVASLL